MINKIYKQIIDEINKYGKLTKPRGFTCKEILNYQFKTKVQDCIITSKVRKLSYPFMVAEWLWILTGSEDLDFIEKFNKNINKYSDDGIKFYGAYGPRFIDQISYIINNLLNDEYSRQAVMTFWHQNPIKSKDIPCTIGLHFMIRENKLNCTSWMRSNDAWFGLPYDTFNFCQITNFICGLLRSFDKYKDLELGDYILNANSLHLYHEQFDIEIDENEKMINPTQISFNYVDPIVNTGLDSKGIVEHIDFLNSYLKKDGSHKNNEFWSKVY